MALKPCLPFVVLCSVMTVGGTLGPPFLNPPISWDTPRQNRHLTANTYLHILELSGRYAPNLIAIRCRYQICGRGVAVTQQLPKLLSRVRVPSPAQYTKREGPQNCGPSLFVCFWYFSAKLNQRTARLPTWTCVVASLFTYKL